MYNLLKEVLPGKTIEKTHRYIEESTRVPVVVTYRHPLDIIASSLQRYQQVPTDENIEKQIEELAAFHIWRVGEIMNKPHVLLLRYESFVNDFDVIFDGFENHFGVKLPSSQRKLLGIRYNVETIAELASHMKSFAQLDTETHWHGNHISPNRGRPDFYKEFFSKKQIGNLKDVYSDYLKIFQYD